MRGWQLQTASSAQQTLKLKIVECVHVVFGGMDWVGVGRDGGDLLALQKLPYNLLSGEGWSGIGSFIWENGASLGK